MNPLERAAHAQTLLDSQTFKELQKAIRDDIIAKLETVPFDDHEKQHELVLMLQIHNRQKAQLKRWIDDGKLEQKVLDAKTWREKVIARARALT